jgi:hypothetical protein
MIRPQHLRFRLEQFTSKARLGYVDKLLGEGSERDLILESPHPNMQLLGQGRGRGGGEGDPHESEFSSALSLSRTRSPPTPQHSNTKHANKERRDAKPSGLPAMVDHWSIAQRGDAGGSLVFLASSDKASRNPMDIPQD